MSLAALLVVLLALPVGALAFLSRKRWDPRGKHCYVTGGSSGLGHALALLLTRSGADVSIVARNQERLDKALADMEAVRQTPNQVLKAYSFSLGSEKDSGIALTAACELHGGQSPDAVFLCAGKSTPGFFIEQDEHSLKQGMEDGYWVQAFPALAAAKRMVADGTKGKIIFVSSVLGLMSIVGYSSYSPAKHALRGLAETLRSEMLLYGIDIHILFPGTIYSPGYTEENKTKPKITLKIEEADEGGQPEYIARALLEGVQRGCFHISVDAITNIFRSSARGSTPFNNYIVDSIYELAGHIALPFWRRSVDKTILGHREEHKQYIRDRGLFTDAGAVPDPK